MAKYLDDVGLAHLWNKMTEYVDSSTGNTGTAGSDHPIKLVENTDSSNKTPLRSLESGTYILKGYFTSYTGGTHSYTFSTGMLVAIVYSSSMSYVQIFYPKNNTIQYLEISDTDVVRNDAKLVNMESIANKVTLLDDTADDDHYPSALAVYTAIQNRTLTDAEKTEIAEQAASLVDTSLLDIIGTGEVTV